MYIFSLNMSQMYLIDYLQRCDIIFINMVISDAIYVHLWLYLMYILCVVLKYCFVYTIWYCLCDSPLLSRPLSRCLFFLSLGHLLNFVLSFLTCLGLCTYVHMFKSNYIHAWSFVTFRYIYLYKFPLIKRKITLAHLW